MCVSVCVPPVSGPCRPEDCVIESIEAAYQGSRLSGPLGEGRQSCEQDFIHAGEHVLLQDTGLSYRRKSDFFIDPSSRLISQ